MPSEHRDPGVPMRYVTARYVRTFPLKSAVMYAQLALRVEARVRDIMQCNTADTMQHYVDRTGRNSAAFQSDSKQPKICMQSTQ